MTLTQQQIIALAVEAGFTVGSIAAVDYVVSSKPYDSVAILERFFKAAYHRGVRDEREALKSICEELEQHYSDYAATALLNGDVDLSNAASGEPRACRAMIDAIRARSAE